MSMTTRPQEARAREGSAAKDPLIGATFAGRYTIRRLLARGGVGLVYLAEQRDPDREVVVKVLAPNWIDNAEAVARFEREGQRLNALQHPNIVGLYECGRENDVAYLAMEHLAGEPLSAFLARKGGRLSVEDFVPIAAQILKGLGYAHSRGLMHRDIKPSNIMLCVRKGRANFVKILDFGMAKLVAGEREITAEQIVGTVDYLSPEQIKGEAVDARVDVYALGVLFYVMLSGRTPFNADNNAAILYKHVNEAPRPLVEVLPPGHGVPRGLIDLVMQCLEKDPEARPADADSMVEELIDCVQASMFHLPVADGATATSSSTISMLAPAITASSSGVQPLSELSTADLAPTTGPERPPTQRRTRLQTQSKLRPPTNNRLRPATLPPGGLTSAAGLTGSGLGPGLGSGLGPEHVSTIITLEAEAVPAQKSSWGIIIGCAAALLAGGLLAAVYVLGDRGDGAAVPGVAADEGYQPNRAHAIEVLDRVDGEILTGDFDRARASLDAATADIDAIPELKQRAGRQRDRIAVATTFVHAQRLEKEGKLPAALGAYRDLLAIDPTHVDARAAVARLTPVAQPASQTVLLPPGSKQPVIRRGGKPGKAGDPEPGGPVDPAVPATDVKPPPEKPEEEDPFLPVAKQDDDGIFLPVGGNK